MKAVKQIIVEDKVFLFLCTIKRIDVEDFKIRVKNYVWELYPDSRLSTYLFSENTDGALGIIIVLNISEETKTEEINL